MVAHAAAGWSGQDDARVRPEPLGGHRVHHELGDATRPRGTDHDAVLRQALQRFDVTLGRFLEAVRLGEEMTQPELARKLRISKSHLNDIEKGRKAVSPDRAARFARILGYSEARFVKLALQDLVDRGGLRLLVDVKAA